MPRLGPRACDGSRVDETGADELVDATESAIIVPVAAAEPAVGRYRQVLDHSALWGVPAHITVLYPFVAPDRMNASTMDAVRAAVGDVRAFECVFRQIKWFRDDVVWLAPEPAQPFRTLTDAVWRRFPHYPPYGGAYPDVIPHLTVGSTRRGNLASLRRAATDLQAALPITAWIDRVQVMAGTDAPGSWRTVAEFALPAE
jgi:2'-5' RNA ligase